MGITISGIVFDGPYLLSNWEIVEGACVYCILYKKEGSWNLAFVGETGNLDDSIRSHHKYNCWIDKAGLESELCIAIYPLPDSTVRQRQRIETRIKIENEPPCNN